MERAVALKKLSKLLGKKLAYRINGRAPTQEEKEIAKAELIQARAERDTIKKQLDEHYKALLAGDAEYQRLRAADKAARERTDRLSWTAHSHKITVGLNEGLFFLVKAEGDSWEEIFEKLEKKAA